MAQSKKGQPPISEVMMSFRFPEAEADELKVDLARAKLSRQQLLGAAIREWRAGHWTCTPDGEVTYPEVERLRAENERLRAELDRRPE